MSQTVFSYSESGHGHENEDFIVVERHPENDEMLLCGLADGQGGRSGGALASEKAVKKSIELAKTFPLTKLLHPTTWNQIISEADSFVYQNSEAGFTTLVIFCFIKNVICGASCGDSHVFYVNDSISVLLTQNQKKNPPVGSSVAYPEPFSVKVDSNWRLLTMSDGVWKNLDWDFIVRQSRQFGGNELIEELKKENLNRTGQKLSDDFSIIVLESNQYAER